MLQVTKSLALMELKEKLESDLYNFEFHKELSPADRMDWVLYMRDVVFSLKEINNNLSQMLDDAYSEGYTDGLEVAAIKNREFT